MALEISPLLALPLANEEQASIDDTRSGFTLELRVIKGFIKNRFWWLCALGIAAIVTLQLSFLPRTSPSRDFRRWHELRFTRTDVKRIFLVQLEIGVRGPDDKTVEQNLLSWLKQLSAVNGKNASVAAGSPGAGDLATFVESQMRSMGFVTTSHTYPVLEKLRSPIALSLDLVDGCSSRVLYSALLHEPGSETPAYYLFGRNGTVKANYVFCNTGSPHDFRILQERSILLRHKIAIFSHALLSEFSLEDKIRMAESYGCVGTVVFGEKELGAAISRDYKPNTLPNQRFRLPVSFKDIEPVLNTLKPASAEFSNWLFSPNSTDDTLELQLTTVFSQAQLNATNIIASVDGVLHDSEIVIGAARDALTSSNPLSGHAILLETMRRIGFLRKMGWKPLRPIRFVSWDASRSGGLGSLENVKDGEVFGKNLPVLAYINLDTDVITGSHLSVDSNPLFNHIVKSTADLVPFPKNSTYYRRLLKGSAGEKKSGKVMDVLEENKYLDFDDDYSETEISLLHYWIKQNDGHINNKLGHTFAGKDSGTFQFQMDTPVVNLGFVPSPRYNDTLYIPESEAYSTKWVIDELDPHLDLHALLVRFLGLFVLSLSEHEVVDSRTRLYFLKAQQYFNQMLNANQPLIDLWSNTTVAYGFLKTTSLQYDIQEKKENWDGAITIHDIFSQLTRLFQMTVEQARTFDLYNQEVENLWTTDYPWYRMIRKIHVYAKFKVTNYKLLRLERELSQMVDWLEDQHDEILEDVTYHHFMFDVPQGVQSVREKEKRGAFAAFYEAFDDHSMEDIVKLAAAKYERLKAVYKKIT